MPGKTNAQARTARPHELECDGPAAEILNVLSSAVLLVDRHQRVCYRNAAAASWLPDGAELSGVFAEARFLDPVDWHHVLTRVLDTGEIVRLECAIPSHTTPTTALAQLRCAPLRESGAEPITWAVILLHERAVQDDPGEPLEVSRRLASLGKLAARVAHELNNPLDGILRYINLAMRLVDNVPDPKLKSYLAESRSGLMRMVEIIGDLLEFSRVNEAALTQRSVNEIVEEAVRASSAAADERNVVLDIRLCKQRMPQVLGSRLYQVCSNLVRNAIDAMPDGGTATISTAWIDECVVIRVADTGVGLPAPAERLFEPFFTTKPSGEGTGLGLAICKDFVEDMGGSITAESGLDNGAVFNVRIPVSGLAEPGKLDADAGSRE